MVTSTRMQLAIGLILAVTCIQAPGLEPNQPPIQLKFVTNHGLLVIQFDKRPPIQPSYAAILVVQWRFEPTGEPNAADLLNTAGGKSVSARQRELVETEQRFWLDYRVDGPYTSPQDMPFGSATYEIRAVSRPDAEKMAYAVVEFLVRDEKESVQRMKREHIEKLSRMKAELGEAMSRTQEQIEARSSEVTAAYEKYNNAIRNSSYSLYRSSDVPEEVRKTIFEMDKMLDVLNIEIAGIQSKLSAIEKYSGQSDVMGHEALRYAVREMGIRQEVELVGAESRRQAIMNVKRREETLYHQYEGWRDLKGEVEDLKAGIERDNKKLKDVNRGIEFVGPGKLTFIIDGRPPGTGDVTIRPVRIEEQKHLPVHVPQE